MIGWVAGRGSAPALLRRASSSRSGERSIRMVVPKGWDGASGSWSMGAPVWGERLSGHFRREAIVKWAGWIGGLLDWWINGGGERDCGRSWDEPEHRRPRRRSALGAASRMES